MRRFSLVIFVGLILSFYLYTAAKVNAGELTIATLRLDRTNPNSATGGMVCARTPSTSNGTEAKVSIIFPTGFTVNSTASNWTVTTSNLLAAGATTWPGISTAVSVSGRTVTFPSSNLSTNTLYCFKFSATNTLTTGNSGNDINGAISTLTNSNTIIDSATYGVSIANDTVDVSATVGANPTDFEASASVTPADSTVSQNTALTYTILYGSNLSTPTNITIEAEWSLGTIGGTSTPTVDILNYVTGSATKAYGSTIPVIDLTNRKITWNITSFPPNSTNQAVTFKLATNASYTGTTNVTFNVAGRLLGPGTQTADSIAYGNYQYNFAFQGGSSSTSSSTANSTSTPDSTTNPETTPNSTPIPSVTQSSNSDVSIQTVLSNNASLLIETEKPSAITVYYGTSPGKLTSSQSDPVFAKSHSITFSDLDPSTIYYFKYRAIDKDGNTQTSDIFTFTTAAPSIAPEIDIQTFILISNNNILSGNSGASGNKPVIVLPVNTSYQFRFSLQGRQSVKRIKAILKSTNVLGINTFAYADTGPNVELQEISPGTYLGKLLGSPVPGIYDLFIQIFDKEGNIQLQKVGKIRIVKPLGIFDKSTKSPIEAAIVLLYAYDPATKLYTKINSEIFGFKNPLNSLSDGSVPAVLAQGHYKANINSLGHKQVDVKFTIGSKNGENYPQIYLVSEPFSLWTTTIYYAGTIYDVFVSTNAYFSALSSSIRFFDLIAAVSLFLLLLTTIFSLSVRTHIPLHSLPFLLIFHLGRSFSKKAGVNYFEGVVIDEKTNKPISRARIILEDLESHQILSQGLSNKLGEFYIKHNERNDYELRILKEGFSELTINFTKNTLIGKLKFELNMLHDKRLSSIPKNIMKGIENLFGFLFELLLFFSLMFEILFLNARGFIQTIPFILLTILTIIIWLTYARRVLARTIISRGI